MNTLITPSPILGQFISTLFASRTQAHVFHLQTNSFAAHKALNEYYDGIIDLADGIAESIQGKYGIITGYSNIDLLEGNEVEEYNKFVMEFFKFEGKDREIELNDLRNDDGILFKKMVDWSENEVVKKLELNMVWYEYSLEDYFRDMFNLNNEDSIHSSFFNFTSVLQKRRK